MIPPKQTIDFVINKLTHRQFCENYDVISAQLSNELFMTVDEDFFNGSSNIIYLSQEEYDNLEYIDPSQYYATPTSVDTSELEFGILSTNIKTLSANVNTLSTNLNSHLTDIADYQIIFTLTNGSTVTKTFVVKN